MKEIYNQHAKAFANVSAYVILKDGNPIAKINYKYPKDGAGRLWCYFHLLGNEMVRGYAGGYGYDKKSASLEAACNKMQDFTGNHQHEPLVEKLSRIGGSDAQYICHELGYKLVNVL